MTMQYFVPIITLFALCISDAYSSEANNRSLKSTVCESCHGVGGNSQKPSLPSLAGQHSTYIIKQINAFNEGIRDHPLLGAKNGTTLSAANTADLAEYFSRIQPEQATDRHQGQERGFIAQNVAVSPVSLKQSQQIPRIKHAESIYHECSGCHGLDGEGIPPYPRLAGQQADYLKRQLTHFKTGVRADVVMKMMTVNLTESDIDALAIYLATINQMIPGANEVSHLNQ